VGVDLHNSCVGFHGCDRVVVGAAVSLSCGDQSKRMKNPANGQCQSVKPEGPCIQQKTLGPGLRRDDDIKAASS
jgi:hypothetical protein